MELLILLQLFATSGNNITSAIVSSAFAGAASNGISVTSGEIYKVTFDYTKNSGDDLRVLFAVSANGAASAISNNVIISASGTYTEYFTITSTTTGYLQMGTGNSGHSLNASITNVSVKEYTSADMDVTRATAATRVDENGLVNYAQVISDTDLVTNGDFATDTDWSKDASWTIANGKASYDGSGNGHRIKQNIPLTIGKTYTASLDILDSSGNFRISVDGGTASYANYTSGDGTYTFEFTSSSVEFSIRASMGYGADTISVDNVSVKEVTRDNVPRIDYTGGGCPHILAEPQRTNEVNYSEDFSQWTSVGSHTAISNTTLSNPSGVSTVGLAEATTGTSVKYFIEAAVSTVKSTASIYLKYNSHQWVQITGLGGKTSYANFDIQNGILGSSSGGTSKITLFGDGWYRCELSETADQNGSNIAVALVTSGTSSRLSNTTLTGSIYMWGAQLEEGSYPTSYIPTSGSTVTRNQDIFTRDGIGSLINSTEGVLFVEMALLIDEGIAKYITLSDGTTDNVISINFDYSSSRIQYRVDSGGVLQSNIKVSYSGTNMDKIAAKWKLGTNEASLWINGVEVGTDTITSAPIGLNTLKFSSASDSGNFYGKVKQLQVYDTALTDTQLAALTS